MLDSRLTVVSVEEVDEPATVYDIEVETDHSFLVHGAVLHNCVRCGAQDGKTWPLGEPHIVPPLHWNCRCVCVPITKTWEQLAKRNKAMAAKLDEMDPGVRASMGGPVSGDTTWESWLGGLGKSQQAEILGPARQKLWDAGKLTITDLVDQRGNALTLEQLRSR